MGKSDRVAVTGRLVPDDSTPARRQRNRVTGALFVIGAALVWASTVLLPGWTDVHAAAIGAIFLVAVAAGVLQWFAATKIPAEMSYLFFWFGTACIAAAQYYAGSGAPAGLAVGMLYVWVTVVAAMYFTPPAATSIAVAVVIAQIVVLVADDVAAWLPQLVLTTGTCAAGGAVAAVLAHRLRGLTLVDALTGVANRRGMREMLDREVTIAAQRGLPLVIVALDLDDFKMLNDTRGHAAGDKALIATTVAWQECLRPGDTLARLGGDEFVVALPGCDAAAGFAIAQRLTAAAPVGLGCSAGVAVFDGEEAGSALLARADAALYQAKSVGGGQAVLAPAA